MISPYPKTLKDTETSDRRYGNAKRYRNGEEINQTSTEGRNSDTETAETQENAAHKPSKSISMYEDEEVEWDVIKQQEKKW